MDQPAGPAPLHGAMRRGFDARSAMLAGNWWAVALRGVVAILFAVAAFVLPFTTLASLVLVLALYLVVDGALAVVSGVRAAAHHRPWGLPILEGVVTLLAGVAAFLLPGLTLLVLVTLLGVWAVISGVLMLAAALRLHGSHGRWLLALSGLVSIVWGVLLYASPVTGALVLGWWLGAYALAFGVVLLALAARLRGRHGPPASQGYAAGA